MTNMDKIVKMEYVRTTTGANTDWVQTNYMLHDNSSGIPKTIKRMMVKNNVWNVSATNQQAYYVCVVVTGTDGVIPTYTGNDTAFNTALNSTRSVIWLTEGGFAMLAENPNDSVILMEPNTGRQLLPGQKLVLCFMSKNLTSSTANEGCGDWIDVNIWYEF
jgi:hypothetical protein